MCALRPLPVDVAIKEGRDYPDLPGLTGVSAFDMQQSLSDRTGFSGAEESLPYLRRLLGSEGR
jgi:hypothetical protein